MIQKLLIANRGEIALRILRACRDLGIKTVAVHSLVDRDLMHVRLADETICIGGNAPMESYLNQTAIISACEISGADAVHPGYGFLAENADFAECVERSGYTFVGPSPQSIRCMGDKIAAIRCIHELDIPTVPGSAGALGDQLDANLETSRTIGYPQIIKATAGGGGRGMRIVEDEKDFAESLQLTRREAKQAFGNDQVYLEKFLRNPRHVEIQVLGDGQRAIHLGTRDCSIQRRHQKLIEEAPALFIDEAKKRQIAAQCVQACEALKYRGAGTFEFLYEDGHFYFIEMNTRIQVEHPVSEMITSVDIIREQILIAAGESCTLQQSDVAFQGHAIECRINAEHAETFLPSPGRITFFHAPGGNGVRVDSHLYSGYSIPPYYDSLIAKIVVHHQTRELAVHRMRNALEELIVTGIDTNISLHQKILADAQFTAGDYGIRFLDAYLTSSFGES